VGFCLHRAESSAVEENEGVLSCNGTCAHYTTLRGILSNLTAMPDFAWLKSAKEFVHNFITKENAWLHG